MSKSTIETVMRRVESATIASPIAVFLLSEEESDGKHLDSVFGATVQTQRHLKISRDSLVGVYNRRHSKDRIKAELTAALKASEG